MKYTNGLIIVCIMFLGFMFMTMREIRTDIEAYDDKIDILTAEIDSVQQLNDELDLKIQSLHSELELIDGDIDLVQNNITNIKQETDEKISRVDSLSISQLQEFFTERYNGGSSERTNSETRN